jgi:predicted porin
VTYYTPRFSGFQFGGSYRPNTSEDSNAPAARDSNSGNITDIFAGGVNYVQSFDGFDVALAGGAGRATAHIDGADDPVSWSLGANLGFGGFTLGGSFA